MTKRAQSALALVAFLVLAAAAPAVAEPVCAGAPMSAKGEASRYQWLAKTKAHANWRAAVRAMADLGPDYANWRKAADVSYDCKDRDGLVSCTFTGTPCKP